VALQRALLAGGGGTATVVVAPLPGGLPWRVRPLRLDGITDLAVVFTGGVEVQALSNASYRWPRAAALLSLSNSSNVSLRGEGGPASLRMWRNEYTDRSRYPEYSEWRHALAIHGCEDVTVERLRLVESGGDGVYLAGSDGFAAYSRNVILRDLNSTGNFRQGLSVISAVNLLITGCSFLSTHGGLGSGIDFEPNDRADRLSNITVSHTTAANNSGTQILLATGKFTGPTAGARSYSACSFVISDSTIDGGSSGSSGVRWNNGYTAESFAGGSLTLLRVTIQNLPMAGLQLEGIAADHDHVFLTGVILRNTATAFPARSCAHGLCASPIVMGDPKHLTLVPYRVGGLSFGPGCVVEEEQRQPMIRRPWLSFVAANGSAGCADVSGSVRVPRIGGGGGGGGGRGGGGGGCAGVALGGEPLVRWGEGVDPLGLSVESIC
jgi:hypothetical protein